MNAERERSMAAKKASAAKPKQSPAMHPFERMALREEQAKNNDPRLMELRSAAAAGDVAKVKQLLALGLDPSAVPPDGKDGAVMAAVWARQPDVVRVLAAAGADVNDGWQYKPLVSAAGWGHLELVNALIEGGADVNLPDDAGDTALGKAVSKKRPAVIEALLRAGADPNFVSDDARERGNVHSPIEIAAYDPALLELFRNRGAGAAGDFSASLLAGALIGAAQRGDLAEVERLIARGADVNATDSDGHFPLFVAASAGKLDVVKALVEAGAKVDQPFRFRARGYAMTALDGAKQTRQRKVVDYLLGLQQSGKAKKPTAKQAARKRPTGVPTFDVNDTCVLVDAPVEEVSVALRKHLDASIHREDVLGETVKLTRRSFAVFRIVGQPWSIVMRLNCADVSHYLRPRDGAALSDALKTRAIVVTSGDTSGIYQYATFDRGQPVELFDVGSAAGDTDHDSITPQFIEWYGVDLGRFKHVTIGGGLVAASSTRKPKLPKGRNALDFIGDYIVKQNGFVPFFGDTWGSAGQKVELTIEGLGPDDIERLDYIATE